MGRAKLTHICYGTWAELYSCYRALMPRRILQFPDFFLASLATVRYTLVSGNGATQEDMTMAYYKVTETTIVEISDKELERQIQAGYHTADALERLARDKLQSLRGDGGGSKHAVFQHIDRVSW